MREKTDRPPASVPTQNAIEEVMVESGYYWPKAQQSAYEMAGLAWACHEISGIESVRVPFDLTVEAEAMGCAVRFGDEPTTPPLASPLKANEMDRLTIASPYKDGRMPEVLKAIEILKEKTLDEIPLIVAIATPFEILSSTMDFEEIAMYFIEDPGFLKAQLAKMTEVSISYASAAVKAGADIIFLADGTSQSIGPPYFKEFSFPDTKELASAIDVPTILHICGNPTAILPLMADTGVSALSIDKPVDITKAIELVGDKVALVGNIAPMTLLNGGPEEIVKEVQDAIDKGVNVVAPGCGILPTTPLAHVKAYVNHVKGLIA
jgi:[methyl-Co(III) methanol-specific corrinoid protein]:coenzyme M methyltransferase